MTKEVAFKDSRIIGTTSMLFVVGGMLSVIPKGNLTFLIFNLLLSLLSGGLFYIFWRKTKHESKRYYSLLSYVMINTFAIYFALPLLRIYYLSWTFWIGIILLIVMVTLPYFYSAEIAVGVQKPFKSKMGKIYLIYTSLVIFFGVTAYSNALYIANTNGLTVAFFVFLLALLFLFISPALLIKPADMDKIMKE